MSNREIKFRVWDLKFKEMLYDAENMISAHGRLYMNYKTGAIKAWPYEYVVQQYTGVNDKNGKPIFEGDFLRYSNVFCNFPVEFKRGCFYVAICYDLTEFTLFELLESELEIVGNIFENPELIYHE